MLGCAKTSMTLDICADLFDEDLDGVADPFGRGNQIYCGRFRMHDRLIRDNPAAAGAILWACPRPSMLF